MTDLRSLSLDGHVKAAVELDRYLTEVADKTLSHRFLNGATQGVYASQVAFLRIFVESKYRDVSTVRILDWGSGKGHISYLLKKEGFDVTSCDIVSESDDSAFAQETPIIDECGIEVVPLLHPYKLPFADGEFDLVVSFGVLEHVENDLLSMTEIRRVLKKNGALFFTFLPYWLSWTQKLAHMKGDYYHTRLYKVGDVARLAKMAGFASYKTWHGQLFPKNSLPYSKNIETIDRILTRYSPFKFFATNLEGFFFVEDSAD